MEREEHMLGSNYLARGVSHLRGDVCGRVGYVRGDSPIATGTCQARNLSGLSGLLHLSNAVTHPSEQHVRVRQRRAAEVTVTVDIK
eukprot:gene9463-biopygen3223